MAMYVRLSIVEREIIYQELTLGTGCNKIAKKLNRHKSTVSREIRRVKGISTLYSPFLAHTESKKRQVLRKKGKKKVNAWLGSLIEKYQIEHRFSPEQISHHLKKTFPDEPFMHVSYETIYKYVYQHTDPWTKRRLIECLRRRKKHRRRRKKAYEKRGLIPNMKTIHERSEAANNRTEPGHWEGDLVVGKDHKSAILTLVERTSRFVRIVKLANGLTSESTVMACEDIFMQFPPALRRSLTYDRGREMALHERLAENVGLDVYFADPHAPWQRGTNENTNGLIREFFPKGTDFSKYSIEDFKRVESLLNTRPRKVLQFATPEEMMSTHLSICGHI